MNGFFRIAFGLALAALAALAAAQGYPARPIRFLVPYPPGGGTDIVARAVADKMQASIGQPVLVENKPGASEIVATDAVAKAAPDGYTIGLVTNSFAINAGLMPKLPFDPAADFAPVAYLVSVPLLLVAHASVPAASVQELVRLARERPGALNYASLGAGSPHALTMQWFQRLAGIELTEVPYKGVAPAMAAVAAGEVQLMFTGLTAGLAQVRAGRLKPLAVSPARRVAAIAQYPTVAESGYPEFDVNTWYGVVAPAKTPPEIVARLNAELGAALRAEDLRQRFSSIGVDPLAMSAAEFAAVMRRDLELWGRIIRATGARPQ